MIIRQETIVRQVEGKSTVIGHIHQKKHRVVVELGGYKFKTDRRPKRANALRFDSVVKFANNKHDPSIDGEIVVLFFQNSGYAFEMIRAVIQADMTVTVQDLGWEDGSRTIQDIYNYYKENETVLI